MARTEQGWPNISESQMQWTNVVMPSVDPDELKIKDVVDLQIKILNTSILRVNSTYYYFNYSLKFHLIIWVLKISDGVEV